MDAAFTPPSFLNDETTRGRYATLKRQLADLLRYVEGQEVLDFGAGFGMSLLAMLDLGARAVIGIEPVEKWVTGYAHIFDNQPRASLIHVPDTRALPFSDQSFDTVVANAVFEHIPQPRDEYMLEVWRVLRVGGALIINETPNKYWPHENHTTGLWFNHWLPERAAHRRALRRGRFDRDRDDWSSSGWRGMGWFEMARPVRGRYELVPEQSRMRHRVFSALGIPASIIDPYPSWVLTKVR